MPRPDLKMPPPNSSPEMGGTTYTPAVMGDPEQFPVLQAFQKYIEEERERARRRVVIVSASAIAAIVVIVAVFLGVGSVVVGNLLKRNDQLLSALLSNATNPAVGVVQAPAVLKEDASFGQASQEQSDKLEELQRMNAALVEQMKDLSKLPETFVDQVNVVVSQAVAKAEAERRESGGVSEAAEVAKAEPKALVNASVPAAESVVEPVVEAKATVAQEGVSSAVEESDSTEELDETYQEVEVKPRADAKPMISGYRGEQLILKTDSGVKIPWRIAVEK